VKIYFVSILQSFFIKCYTALQLLEKYNKKIAKITYTLIFPLPPQPLQSQILTHFQHER